MFDYLSLTTGSNYISAWLNLNIIIIKIIIIKMIQYISIRSHAQTHVQ